MKKIKSYLLVSIFLILSSNVYSQVGWEKYNATEVQSKPTVEPKWRTLTLSNTTGFGVNNSMFNQFAASLYYELPNKWAISSWNAINVQRNTIAENWASSQSLILRQSKQWNYGIGYQYGSGGAGVVPINNNQSFAIVHISKRFKL